MRETTEIKTPGGHTIVVNSYVNGRESRALQVPYLKNVIELDAARVAELGEKAARFEAAQNLALRTVIVSFDGKKDGQGIEGTDTTFDLIDTLLALPAPEYRAIVKAMNEVIADDDYNEKKKES